MTSAAALLSNYTLTSRSRVILAILLLAIPALSYALWLQQPQLAEENGALEHFQVGLIALACFIHSVHSIKFNTSSLGYVIRAGFALLTYSFLLRELDIEHLGSSPLWATLERALRILRVVLWLGFFVFIAKKAKLLYGQRAGLSTSTTFWLSAAGGMFLIAGGIFDRHIFSSIPFSLSRLAEEVLELNGYFLIFVASLCRATAPLLPAKSSASAGA